MLLDSQNSPDLNLADDKLVSFIQVAEQYRTNLTWVAARITRSTEEAEDIVQLALLKAYRSLSRFQGNSQMRTWLYVIVQNTAREHMRNQKRRCMPLQSESVRPGDDDNTLQEIRDPGKNPEEIFERCELETILHSEIDALSPLCKRAIETCALGELSQQAAARELNISAVTVKSRVFRAKKILGRAVCLRLNWPQKAENREPAPSSRTGRKSKCLIKPYD